MCNEFIFVKNKAYVDYKGYDWKKQYPASCWNKLTARREKIDKSWENTDRQIYEQMLGKAKLLTKSKTI